jgi:hypothetical protein
MDKDLCREAAESAIAKHSQIIEDLKDIVALNYQDFRIINNSTEEQITDLKLINFILENVKYKANSIKANESDIQTCYEQMGVFKISEKE